MVADLSLFLVFISRKKEKLMGILKIKTKTWLFDLSGIVSVAVITLVREALTALQSGKKMYILMLFKHAENYIQKSLN